MKKHTRTDRSRKNLVVFDMHSNACVWSKAGVIAPTQCINAFDCLNCPLHKRLKRDVAEGRLKDGRAPVDWRVFPDRRPPEAEQMKCRHMLSGRVSYKYCINNYNCDACEYNEMMENEVLAGYEDHSLQKIVAGFAVAENYYYHRGHTWARVEYGQFVRIGIDDFAARVFGPFGRINTPGLGAAVSQDEPFGELIRDDLHAGILSPVEGVVVAVNPRAAGQEEFPEWEPYDAGWLMLVKPVKLTARLRRLLFEDESRRWMENEAAKLSAMISEEEYPLAAAGGRAMPDIYGHVGHMPELGWDRLKRTFLHT